MAAVSRSRDFPVAPPVVQPSCSDCVIKANQVIQVNQVVQVPVPSCLLQPAQARSSLLHDAVGIFEVATGALRGPTGLNASDMIAVAGPTLATDPTRGWSDFVRVELHFEERSASDKGFGGQTQVFDEVTAPEFVESAASVDFVNAGFLPWAL